MTSDTSLRSSWCRFWGSCGYTGPEVGCVGIDYATGGQDDAVVKQRQADTQGLCLQGCMMLRAKGRCVPGVVCHREHMAMLQPAGVAAWVLCMESKGRRGQEAASPG